MPLDRSTLQTQLDIAMADSQSLNQSIGQISEQLMRLQTGIAEQRGAFQYLQLHIERLRKQLAELAAEAEKPAS